MKRSNTAILIGAVLAAFAIGLLLGRHVDRGQGQLSDSAGNSLVAPSVRNADANRRAFQNPRAADAPRAARSAPDGFAFQRLILETDGDAPRACLQFSSDLAASGEVNYADYVRVTPAASPAVSIAGSSLCIAGLEFDKEYVAKLRAGLPAGDGSSLERPVEVTIAFGDKPAYVGLAGNGVVLPRLEADGLAIETVNVDKVSVDIYRVSDRAIARKRLVAGESLPEDQYYYVYGEENGEDVGAKVHSSQIDVDLIRNETVTTVFPFGAALPNLKPGAYFVRVADVSLSADNNRKAESWRWIVYTDMALTTYSSSEGVDVFVRSLKTGKAISGVSLELIAQNNDILAGAQTNADGAARFPKAAINADYPQTPKMILAYGAQDDFAAIDLTRAPLDLSDRDVAGRSASSVIDAFVFLDRGIYRPGETPHVTALLRDDAGRAADRPATVTIYRPNGSEAFKNRFDALTLGGVSIDYTLPKSAPRGVWRVSVEAEGLGQVGDASFAVEDFVPQRLEVVLDLDEETPIAKGETRSIAVNSRYLYGAPAGDLPVEAEARLRIDPNPFPDYIGYRFGPADPQFNERFITLDAENTNAAGESEVALAIDGLAERFGAPLRADLVVGVIEPGGRAVRESARVPVRAAKRYVGLRLEGGVSGFGQNDPANIEALIVDREGAQQEGDLEWRLVEEDYWFDWYRSEGQWRWRRSYKDVLVAEGRTEAGAGAPARISRQLAPGSYRLSATDIATGVKSDIRFYVGWRSYESGVATPDQASLTLTNQGVEPGARAKLFLDPPYAGEALIAIATDRVHLVKRVKVEEGGREITIDTDPEWGSGFYVLATVITPRDPVARPVPRRAMGIAHVPFDMSERTLSVALGAPEVVRPRQTIDVPVTITGANRGEDVMVTLAAVDEGILRLTKFETPDPVDHYYGKKRLGVELRDDYGRILNANLGAPVRVGGDQLGGEGLTVVPTKSVALFEGPVMLDDDGRGAITIDVPDFNGELRLMAVAWSDDKLGGAGQPMTVRDPVPAELAMPRFLAPGDTTAATLLVDNVEGQAGDYVVKVDGEGPVIADASRTYALGEGDRETDAFEFRAGDVGVGALSLSVDGPGAFSVSRDYPLQVRTPYYPVTEISSRRLQPGEKLSLTAALTAPYYPASSTVNVSFSPLRGVDPGPLVESLRRYPYGCTEQLTSSAMPLLFANLVGAAAGQDADRALRPRVQEAINKVLDRQSPGGEFGLWREGDGYATAWLGGYVTDFLYRAREEGYAVPETAMEKAYQSLTKVANLDRWSYVRYQRSANEGPYSNDTTDQLRYRSAAYALYVLAREGRADLSDLRYAHDALIDTIKNPLARAHIAAALNLMGDRARALSAFTKAREAIGFDNTGDYYQSPLRDVAGVLALLTEMQNAPGVDEVTDAFATLMREPTSLHTQEKAFVLLAAQGLLKQAGEVALTRNNEALPLETPAPRFTIAPADLQAGAEFANAGDGPLYASVAAYGAPKSAPPAVEQGFAITKRVATRDGRPADLSAVRQNDRLVVVLNGQPTDKRLHPAIIADLLPAGFEIEAVLTPEDGARKGASGPYDWIGEISRPKIAEARDDRFVAAIDLYDRSFTLAYVVRAVSPGDFAMPGAVIEDMYRPGVVGRTGASRVAITAAQ